MMSKVYYFTVDDVREIQKQRANKSAYAHKLTGASRAIVRSAQFTSKDINTAYAAARESLDTN